MVSLALEQVVQVEQVEAVTAWVLPSSEAPHLGNTVLAVGTQA